MLRHLARLGGRPAPARPRPGRRRSALGAAPFAAAAARTAPAPTRALSSAAAATAPASGGAAAPKKRKGRALPPPLSVTPAAARRILGMLESKPDTHGVLLGVKRRGCNGMSYTLNYADEPPPASHEKIEADGATVWIEPPALFHIVGTTPASEARRERVAATPRPRR